MWFLDKNRSNEFYFRAKNSVEHISPQTRNENYKKDNLVSDNYLHSFGNLALVSRERNSEFGNKPFEVKQIDFKTKKDDISNNLKMSLIYENENWGDEKCKEHLKDIYRTVYASMPLQSYLWIHDDAILTKEQRTLIRDWTGVRPK